MKDVRDKYNFKKPKKMSDEELEKMVKEQSNINYFKSVPRPSFLLQLSLPPSPDFSVGPIAPARPQGPPQR
eukprot:356247-Hanusia_phi.AAC.2